MSAEEREEIDKIMDSKIIFLEGQVVRARRRGAVVAASL